MLGHSVPNDKQQSVLMSTLNRGQVPQTRTPSLKFTNNVICESSNSASTESDQAGAVFAATEGAFLKGILAIEGSLAGRKFDDIILDTGSAVSLISTSLLNQLPQKLTRNQVKSKYVVANGTTLPVEKSTELPIKIGGLEVTHRFIIVSTKVANILLNYNFLKSNKCDIMTSMNSLVADNVAIPIHSIVSNTVVGIIDIAVRSIDKFTKLIVLPSIENNAALLTNELHLRRSRVKQN